MQTQGVFDHCIILHGCPPGEAFVTPKEKRWMNWLEQELIKKGLHAKALDMPTPWAPQYLEWKKVFETYPISKDSILIGHSCGGAFIVRWLIETGKRVKKAILVAPAKIPETLDDTRKDLYDFDLPADKVSIADEVVVFTSNDFPHHLASLDLYTKALHPRIIHLENKGHFLYVSMGTNEFPELLEEVITSHQ